MNDTEKDFIRSMSKSERAFLTAILYFIRVLFSTKGE